MAFSSLFLALTFLISAETARPARFRGHPRALLAAARGSTAVAKKGEPQSLAEYCKGEPAPIRDEQYVEANWEGYGSYYPARIYDVNKNKTVDLKYDDGWVEKRVDSELVRPTDGKETQGEAEKPDDAACQVVQTLEDVKQRVKDAEKDVSLWVKSKQAKEHGVKPGGTLSAPTGKTLIPNAAPAPAPAPAIAAAVAPPATAEESDELERLKEELFGLDTEIMDLSKEIAANDQLIHGDLAEDRTLDDGVLTVDELIQQYKERIEQRKDDLAALKARRKQQDEQLARVGVSPVSLSKIQEDVRGISEDVAGLKQTRDKLDGEGNLDPELRYALDKLIERGDLLAARVDELVKAEEEASKRTAAALAARRKIEEEARKLTTEARKAKRDADAAARRARKKARQAREKMEAEAKAAAAAADARVRELENAKKAAAAADARIRELENAKKAAVDAQHKAAEEGDRQVMAAAMAVQDGLNGLTAGTRDLDSNVHPNGEKWWRYRYEHAFVEGLLMCFVTVFIFFWEWVLKSLQTWVLSHSHLQFQRALSYGTLYMDWFGCALCELVACFLTFLTVWFLGHFYIFNIFPQHLPSTKHLHLPSTGEEYRALASEMVIIVSLAMLLYFALLFAVVRSTVSKILRWAKYEVDEGEAMSVAGVGVASEFGRSFTMAGSTNEFKQLERFFLVKILAQDREAIDNETFSFWKYLRANVRAKTDSLWCFGPLMWIPILLTFGIFVLLHGWAHVGYIRIMSFFLVLLVATLAFMTWVIIAVTAECETSVTRSMRGGDTDGDAKPMLANSARFSFWAMEFSLFFLCYGAARTFCQPWMWELYFNAILCLTLATLLICAVFVIWVAPLVPTFTASLALPPYIGASHVKGMKDVLEKDMVTAKEFAEN